MPIEGTTIEVPAPKEGAKPLTFDLSSIYMAESRQQEVAIVTPIKAPELLWVFNKAWLDVDGVIKRLSEARTSAEREVEKVRADLLLNRIEDILKLKNVSSTKDTRDAVIVLDPSYQAAQDRVDQIHATCEWLKGKRESFENSFTSVKKIMGEDTYNMSGRLSNPNLSHGAPAPRPALAPVRRSETESTSQRPTTPAPSGYGKSRY